MAHKKSLEGLDKTLRDFRGNDQPMGGALILCQMQPNIQAVVDKVFPNLTINYKNSDWLYERAFLAPKNDDVNKLNDQIQLKLPGEEINY